MEHGRKSTRAPVDITPRYRSPTSFDYVEGRCVDLSEGGMFIVAQLPCEAGTLLKFECEVAGSEALRGVARVVWKRHGEGDDRPSGMGLKFVKLEQGSPEAIAKLVADAQARGTTAPEEPLPAHVAETSGTSFPPPDPSKPEAGMIVVPSAFPAPAEPSQEALASALRAATEAQPEAQPSAPSAESAAPVPATKPATGQEAQESGGSAAVWIALAVGAALLGWLLLRG